MPAKPTKKVPEGKLKIRKNPSRRMALFGTVGMLLVLGAVWLFASHAATGNRVAIAADATGKGYWEAAADGGVFAVGDAPFYGSMGGRALAAPIVGMVATPDEKGYYLVGQDGGVFTFGDAVFHGSLPANFPTANVHNIVGMAVTPNGGGYWLVGSDGGIFSFGNAPFKQSLGGKGITDIVGMAATADGQGYWLAGADGGVFAFGDAPFKGSLGGQHLAAPVSGIARQAGTNNYWLTGQDGGVFTFGSGFYGSMSGKALTGAVLGMASSPDGQGYWLVGADGGVFSFGDAVFSGTAPQVNPATVTVSTQPKPICASMDVTPSGQTATISGVGLNTNGNPYKNTVINWGDGSATTTVANAVGQAHVFGYGSFTITATPHFTWNNQDYAAPACQKAVSFAQPAPAQPAKGGDTGSKAQPSYTGPGTLSTGVNCSNPANATIADACISSGRDTSTSTGVNCSNPANATQADSCISSQNAYQASAGQAQTTAKAAQLTRIDDSLGYSNGSGTPTQTTTQNELASGAWSAAINKLTFFP